MGRTRLGNKEGGDVERMRWNFHNTSFMLQVPPGRDEARTPQEIFDRHDSSRNCSSGLFRRKAAIGIGCSTFWQYFNREGLTLE